MKQKTSKFKRVAITALAAVCALSSATAISVGAVDESKINKTVNGKHIYAQAYSYNSYGKIYCKSYSGPVEIKIDLVTNQRNKSNKNKWQYTHEITSYTYATTKELKQNAKSGYQVKLTYGTTKFGGVGSYRVSKRTA